MNIPNTIKVDKEQKRITIDDFDFYLVMDGYYRLDGGTMYGVVYNECPRQDNTGG